MGLNKKRPRRRLASSRNPLALTGMPQTRVIPAVSELLADAQTIAGRELVRMKAAQDKNEPVSARDLKDLVSAVKEGFLLEQEIIENEDLEALDEKEVLRQLRGDK